jgi:hypothetical protein
MVPSGARVYERDAPSSRRAIAELDKPRVREKRVQIAEWSTLRALRFAYSSSE